MNRPNDIRIETFRQTVARLTVIPGALQTLAITLQRANELPDLIANTDYSIDRKRFREEQSAIGYPMTHRIRQAQMESELRQGLFGVRDQLRSAIAAATEYVGIAAGGPDAVRTFPFARRVLAELERHRVVLPTTASTAARLAFLKSAWFAIDAAMGSLDEIRWYARRRAQSA
jgi:hypothetical protein